MQIRCWGSRGQIPVNGSKFLKYGGDTTCIEIRSKEDDIIIIDAGSGISHLGKKLTRQNKKVINILFTHLHLDHIIGLPFFSPLFKRDYSINIYGCAFNGSLFRESVQGIMRDPYFPVDFIDIPSKVRFFDIREKPFKIGSIRIKPVILNHPNGALGFRFEENNRSFVFMTDNELGAEMPDSVPLSVFVKFCQKCDLLIHDAELKPQEYVTQKAWGHSTYQDAVRLGMEADVKRLGLFHINHNRVDSQVDAIVSASKTILLKNKSKIDCFAVGNKYVMTI